MDTLMIGLIIMVLIGAGGCDKNESSSKKENLPTITGYPIVGTNQTVFYSNNSVIAAPTLGQSFYGQNGNYLGSSPTYVDNGDGTVTDMVTGLMWSKTPDLDGDGDIDYNDKMSYYEALSGASTFRLAGYSDWRLPTIKELYSLIDFSGADPSGYTGTSTTGLTPFINTKYFAFAYGDQNAGERIIDAQFATTTKYVSTTMTNDQTMFGVNFADGRIKGYPIDAMPGQSVDKQFYVYFVRGNSSYGMNSFVNNGNGTITDNATGLMWMQADNGVGVTWEDALTYAEGKEFAGYSDWRLPNIKELHSIVDYTLSPATSSSATINPVFSCTQITNEAGNADYPYYWSSTTHATMGVVPGANASYFCFGRAMGYMSSWIDVHGAGAQRSDPKVGDPASYPTGHGPQGDAIRIYNYVRLVRNVAK